MLKLLARMRQAWVGDMERVLSVKIAIPNSSN